MADPATWETLKLSPEHLRTLQDSGISPEVAGERGYRTAASPFEVPEIFSRAQRKLVPSIVIPVYGVDDSDEPVTYELRPDNPRTDGRSGKIRKYEYPRGAPKRLDVPRRVRPMLGMNTTPLWFTEGARKADSAASIGLACVSLSGVWAFRSSNPDGGKVELPDFDRIAFNGRDVFICFDSDVVDKPPVRRAMSRLGGVLTRRGATVKVVVLGTGPGGTKNGLDDVIAAGAREADLLALVDDGFLEDERGLDVRLRDYIVDNYELGRDTDANAFALPLRGPRVVRMISVGRPSLEIEAPARFSRDDPASPVVPRRTVRDVMHHVEGMCLETESQELFLRTARCKNGIVVDLGDDTGRVVAVSPRGWRVVDRPPAGFPLFRRTENVRPLPVPETGGSLDELRELLNVTDETWPLVQGWLIAALFGWIPRPWLYNTGPQGSGKSDGANLILNVTDPRTGLVPAPRKNDRHDPATYAINSHLLGYDNVSKVTAEFSDWLCALVTGTTESRRILHTTASIFSVSLMRTGIITGIGISGVRPDLAERLVRVEYERIPESRRKGHAKIAERFRKQHPRILGALLDAVSTALAHLDEVDEDKLQGPRMSDYAAILRAHDLGAGTDLFGDYRDNVSTALADIGEDDPVAAVVLDYLDQNGNVDEEPASLYRSLSVHRTAMDLPEDAYWPKRADELTKALRGLVAALEDRVTLRFPRVKGRRRIIIEKLIKGDASAGQGDAKNSRRHPTASPQDSQVRGGSSSQGDAMTPKSENWEGEITSKEYPGGVVNNFSPYRDWRAASLASPASPSSSGRGFDEALNAHLPKHLKIFRPEDPTWSPSTPRAVTDSEEGAS